MDRAVPCGVPMGGITTPSHHSCFRGTRVDKATFLNSLRGALEQLALMVMQTGIGLTRSDTIAYAASVIDVVVQLNRDLDGRRGISQIAQSADLL